MLSKKAPLNEYQAHATIAPSPRIGNSTVVYPALVLCPVPVQPVEGQRLSGFGKAVEVVRTFDFNIAERMGQLLQRRKIGAPVVRLPATGQLLKRLLRVARIPRAVSPLVQPDDDRQFPLVLEPSMSRSYICIKPQKQAKQERLFSS